MAEGGAYGARWRVSERVEALRRCRVLKGFSDVGLKILAHVARDRVYVAGQPLQTQGKPPLDQGAVVFLVKGRVRCEVRDSEGKTLVLGVLAPGEHLGAARLFGEESMSPLTAVADTDVHALLIDTAAFEKLWRHKPQTAMKFILALGADVSARLAENSESFADFAHFVVSRASQSRRSFTTYSEISRPEDF